MEKHTKKIIIFFIAMMISAAATFSILYLLPLVTSGTDPPVYSETLPITKAAAQ